MEKLLNEKLYRFLLLLGVYTIGAMLVLIYLRMPAGVSKKTLMRTHGKALLDIPYVIVRDGNITVDDGYINIQQ
jgi:hypothetical protein